MSRHNSAKESQKFSGFFLLEGLVRLFIRVGQILWLLVRNPPSWQGMPVAFSVRRSAHVFRRMLVNSRLFFKEIVQEHGSVAVFWLGPQPVICLADPVAVRQVLTDPRRIGKAKQFMAMFARYFGQGVFDQDGATSVQLRQVMGSTMGPKNADEGAPFIQAAVSHLIYELARKSDDPEGVEAFPLASDAAMAITCRAILGVELSEGRLKQLRHLLETLIADHLFKGMNDLVRSAMGRLTKGDKHAIQDLRELLSLIMHDYEKQYSGTPEAAPGALGALFQAYWRKDLTREDVLINFQHLAAAGIETTSGAIVSIIYELAKHPEVFKDELLTAEVVQHALGIPLTQSVLFKLTRVRAIVREALRLRAPLVNMIREINEELILILGDGRRLVLPRGTYVAIPLRELHSSGVWKNGQTFDPSRFLGEEGRVPRPGMSEIPFGGGEFICLGMHAARRTIESVVVQLVEKVATIEVVGEPSEVSMLTSRLDLKVKITLKK